MVRKSLGAPPAAHGTLPAEPSTAADALQRPLRSRFQARLSASVRRQALLKKNQKHPPERV
jgi:hypothetical protein